MPVAGVCVGCGRGAGKDLRRGYIVPNFAGQFFSTVEDVTKIRFPFNFGGECDKCVLKLCTWLAGPQSLPRRHWRRLCIFKCLVSDRCRCLLACLITLFGADPGGLAVHPKYLDTVPNVTWYDDEALWVTGTKVRVCVVVAGVAVVVWL